MANYKKPIYFSDIKKQDEEVTVYLENKYKDEILYFQRTAELYISLFSNAERTFRKNDKIDYIQLAAVKILQDSRATLSPTLKFSLIKICS